MELTLDEAKNILRYIIKNNKNLQEKGQYPIAVSLCGDAGIGKTSICDQLAEELDANYIKLSLAMMTDPSELIGWPFQEYHVCKDNECEWISAKLIDAYTANGWTITPETRMSYAVPKWIEGLDTNKSTIIVLDDITRASEAILQASMEIINRQEYISWKLPKNTTVILTENPDNGKYNVSSIDEAQKSRYMRFNIKFSKDAWARFAENSQLDSRGINFLLSYSDEIMKENEQHMHPVNARNYTMFINTISGIEDWSKTDSLELILQIASGAFVDDKDNIIGSLFTTFIANKLDKLISPEDLLLKPWEVVKPKIKDCVYDSNGNYRPDIAGILHTRLLNYCIYYFGQKGSKTDVVQDRLLKLIECDDNPDEESLFSSEFLFDIIKTLIKQFPSKTNKFMLNSKIRNKVL